ncbi:pseudouridylate synthase 7 homolog-like protein [Tachyglossus aculeatus]|uniref:pseudouridylate synthase 7 homolog-like protein n=1 Tax=Tachyglossus aculeatus TaxID=9261 RepID=UPI0018F5D27B|nr:pseudouridylate synthase 7 homolog-like protein [Tachyglossus aculeatus]
MFPSLSYLHSHMGFCGTIKNSPSDFIVVEIDAQGQSVGQSRNDFSEIPGEQRSSGKCNHKKPRLDPQKLRLEDGGNEEFTSSLDQQSGPEEILKFAREDEDCSALSAGDGEWEKDGILESLLNTAANESLNQFACDIKDTWNSEAERTGPSELSLGAIVDKKQRACLHSAIRQKFPFLITVTKNREIVVKPNIDYKELRRLVSEEEADNFFRYLDAKRENSKFTFKPDPDKEHRKAVHHFVNQRCGKLVETKSFSVADSVAGSQSVVITVRFREKTFRLRKRRPSESRDKQDEYTAFTLRKENLETFEAIGYLSSELGVLPSDFSYSGIKDKKAITYQAMVVKKVAPERLKEIGSAVEKKGISVSNIHPVQQPLRLGQLTGNRFEITVRDLKRQTRDSAASPKERILEAIENVKTGGFINYYGPQRFGQWQSVQTDQIGLALLNNEMVKAVKLFFTPEELDDPVNRAKKHFFQTEDAKGTLALLPEYKIRERSLLRALNRYGVTQEGCARGWLSIPHSMRIFYVHAYCSKIWNEAASYRLETYGSKVIEGDLVFSEERGREHLPLSDRVRVISAEEEAANAYAVHQVVLPMVGHSILYPKNKVGQWYRERLGRDGLQECKFRVSALQLNVPGCYRQLVKYPRNVSYRLPENRDVDGKMEASFCSEQSASLHISFDLDASCYATVCLREIMKCDL